MFTGIIQAVGEIASVTARAGDVRLGVVAEGLDWDSIQLGDSIAVNGVCLTAVEFLSQGFVADVSRETLDVSSLSDAKVGMQVNLEPALCIGDALGGHLVSGHVDGLGTILSITEDARSSRYEFKAPEDLRRYIAKKGSVCIDGVSLTVNSLSAEGFSVNIVPHTMMATIFAGYQVGTVVNLEVDMLARYLERLMSNEEGHSVTREFLKAHGYVR